MSQNKPVEFSSLTSNDRVEKSFRRVWVVYSVVDGLNDADLLSVRRGRGHGRVVMAAIRAVDHRRSRAAAHNRRRFNYVLMMTGFVDRYTTTTGR